VSIIGNAAIKNSSIGLLPWNELTLTEFIGGDGVGMVRCIACRERNEDGNRCIYSRFCNTVTTVLGGFETTVTVLRKQLEERFTLSSSRRSGVKRATCWEMWLVQATARAGAETLAELAVKARHLLYRPSLTSTASPPRPQRKIS